MHRPARERFILWNEQRTEAKLEVDTYYGGLDATSYDVRLKRFGKDWVVIETTLTIIS